MTLRQWIWRTPLLSDARRLECFPPFWLMRIKVLKLGDNWRVVRIRLPRTWIAKNSGGSIFGGFQASLADPIAAMACARIFPGYSVWTRSLALDFRSEGITDLELRFEFSRETETIIRDELEAKGRSTPMFEYAYFLADGSRCTLVKSSVAIRPKGYRRQ